MSNADRDRHLDRLTAQFLTALELGDFEIIERIWVEAESDTELERSLLEAVVEISRIDGSTTQADHAACVSAHQDAVQAFTGKLF